MALDFKCGCHCFGLPFRTHSTIYCKYLEKHMAERGFVLKSWGRYEEAKKQK